MIDYEHYWNLHQVKAFAEQLVGERNFVLNSLREFLRGKITIWTHNYQFKNFEFNKLAYPDTENPNLDGKTVRVIKVRIIDHTDNDRETVKYAFFDEGKIFRKRC